MPAQGSPVTLRTVLPQPSREESPDSEITFSRSSMSRSGTWWICTFWRVVMWPLFSGAQRSTTSAKDSICSGVTPPKGSLTRTICTSG